MKKTIIVLIILVLVLSLVSCQNETEKVDAKNKEIIKLLKEGNFDGARELSKIVYKDNKEAVLVLADLMEEYYKEEISSTTINPIESLKIQDGWTSEIKDDYIYIKGRVKNISDKNINYFEVNAEYLNPGNQVLDTDFTNSAETIRPNSMKEFEIMHKYNKDYFSVNIFIGNVTFE